MPIDINDLKPLEPEFNFDIDKHVGQKKKIEKVYIDEVDSKYGSDGKPLKNGETERSTVLRVESEVLETIENSKGEKKDVRATAMFNIKVNKDGTPGWGHNDKKPSKLQKFLKRMGVTHPKDLVGLEVRVQEGKNGFPSYPIE